MILKSMHLACKRYGAAKNTFLQKKRQCDTTDEEVVQFNRLGILQVIQEYPNGGVFFALN